jgi:hypothetical protein
MHLSSLPTCHIFSRSLHPYNILHLVNIIKLLITQFSSATCCFLLLSPDIPLSNRLRGLILINNVTVAPEGVNYSRFPYYLNIKYSTLKMESLHSPEIFVQ